MPLSIPIAYVGLICRLKHVHYVNHKESNVLQQQPPEKSYNVSGYTEQMQKKYLYLACMFWALWMQSGAAAMLG